MNGCVSQVPTQPLHTILHLPPFPEYTVKMWRTCELLFPQDYMVMRVSKKQNKKTDKIIQKFIYNQNVNK